MHEYTACVPGILLCLRRVHIYSGAQGSPSGCVRREIPGVAQVDEKGHEGNTVQVVTAHLCWRNHGQINSRTGVPAVLFTLNIVSFWGVCDLPHYVGKEKM